MTGPVLRAGEMMEHVRVLAEEYPHRHTGERGERQAVEYIAGQFRDIGLATRVHELSVMGWELTALPELEFLSPEARSVECVPFIFSGSTPADGLIGRVIHVGPTDVVGIAPPWEKYAIVDDEDHPRAFIVGRPSGPAIAQSGPPAGSAGTQDGPHYTWPACSIGADDLRWLRSCTAARHTPRARLSITARYKPQVTSFVVQADLLGAGGGRNLIAVGAHHDCQGAIGFPPAADSPGGCDNASGVAAIIELARHFRENPTQESIRFLTYGGEEWNLTGSRHYVRMLKETGELETLRAKVNVDQAANGDRLIIQASTAAVCREPRITIDALATEVVAELGIEGAHDVVWHVPPNPGSDHWPYHVAGVPVFYSRWDPVPAYHRAGDTASRCTRDDKYELNVELIRMMITRLASL